MDVGPTALTVAHFSENTAVRACATLDGPGCAGWIAGLGQGGETGFFNLTEGNLPSRKKFPGKLILYSHTAFAVAYRDGVDRTRLFQTEPWRKV